MLTGESFKLARRASFAIGYVPRPLETLSFGSKRPTDGYHIDDIGSNTAIMGSSDNNPTEFLDKNFQMQQFPPKHLVWCDNLAEFWHRPPDITKEQANKRAFIRANCYKKR